MTKARELAELSRTVSDSADAVAITINSSEQVSFSSDVLLADNGKAIFGAGSDLQIYHDANNSFIKDSGTGSLYVQADAGVYITNASGSENKAIFTSDGAVNLYHDNALKFVTTSTGIDVTGTVTATAALEVESGVPYIDWTDTATTDENTRAITYNGDFYIGTIDDAKTTTKKRFLIDHSTGDISFYEDTGTTAKLFWDASTESLGIGTTSPDFKLQASGANTQIGIESTTNGQNCSLYYTADGANQWEVGTNITAGLGYEIYDRVNNASRMVVDHSGNVGIGTSSPTSTSNVTTLEVSNATTARLLLDSTGTGGRKYGWYSSTDGQFAVYDYDADSERMRIDSSGRVGIGTSSPNKPLTVAEAQTANTAMEVLRLTGSGTYNSSGSSNAGAALSFGQYSGTYPSWNLAQIDGIRTGSSWGGSLVFRVNNDSAQDNSAEAMRINSSGDVGIGSTTVDRGKLHVNHIVQSSGGAFNDPHIALSFSSAPTDNDSFAGISYATSDSDNYGWTVGAERTTSGVGDFIFTQHNNSATGSEKVRIDSSGNVGIGTGSPSSELHVKGADETQIYIEAPAGSNAGIRLLENGTSKWTIGNDQSNDGLFFYDFTAAAERFRIDSDGVANFNGDVKVLSGDVIMGNGRGINFTASSNASGMTSETLDDYEEGTWTPSLSASSTNPTPTAVTVNYASYTKIGNTVFIRAYITVNLTSIGSGGAEIQGLPFTVKASAFSPVFFTHGSLIHSSGGYFVQNTTRIAAIANNDTASIAFAGTGNRYLMISGQYEV